MSSGSADSSSLRVLVYGGSGALGKAVVTSFKKHGATVHNVDFSVNPEACHNHIVDKDFEASLTKVVKELDAESAKTGGTNIKNFPLSIATGIKDPFSAHFAAH